MPERTPCSYEVVKEGDETVIRFDWIGCPYSASLESDANTMARVMDALLQVRDANRVVIAEAYEYEYSPEQTMLLSEIAQVIDLLLREQNILAKARIIITECQNVAPQSLGLVEDLLINGLRQDPVGSYLLILQAIGNAQSQVKNSPYDRTRACYQQFLSKILNPIKLELEKTKMIQQVKSKVSQLRPGDRRIYEDIFRPELRPNFTLTRFMIEPPKNAELIDSYPLTSDTLVEIYRIEGQTEKYYHVIPPEFRLPEEQYEVLGLARKVMVSYKPQSTQFTERTREYFQKVGEDLLGTIASERNITLKHSDIEQLASILTRYTTGLGIIEVLLADPKLQDIYINSPIGEKPILVLHADFEECITNLIPTQEDAEIMAARFRLQSGRPLDEAEPVLDTSTIVPGGRARVCVITRNLSPRGLAFAFRRHRSRPWTFPLFIKNKMISPLAAGLLWFVIDGGRTILYAGPRSSGKTSMLSATIIELMRKYRVITVEDTLELPVDEYRRLDYNMVSLKVQSVITKLQSEIPADEGIRTALRLGDSCLIIGEVRSKEARALYEAMRVGALSNVVAGTIHGDDPYGVWDRVVNDLGVPSTSFKATDLLVMPAPIRSADGLHRARRLVTITEIGKKWTEDPLKEGGLIELMRYNAKTDVVEPTPAFLEGKSEVLNAIASRVKEWSGNWDAVMENIQLRSDVKQGIVDLANKSKNYNLLEAEFVGSANNQFHLISEQVSQELGAADAPEILKRWNRWATENARKYTMNPGR